MITYHTYLYLHFVWDTEFYRNTYLQYIRIFIRYYWKNNISLRFDVLSWLSRKSRVYIYIHFVWVYSMRIRTEYSKNRATISEKKMIPHTNRKWETKLTSSTKGTGEGAPRIEHEIPNILPVTTGICFAENSINDRTFCTNTRYVLIRFPHSLHLHEESFSFYLHHDFDVPCIYTHFTSRF